MEIYEKKIDRIGYVRDNRLYPNIHCHNEFEIIICNHGKFKAYINAVEHTVSDNSLLLILPNQVHHYENIINGDYRILIFSADNIPFIAKKFNNIIIEKPTINLNENEVIKSKINELENEYSKDNSNASTLLTGYVNILMYYLAPIIKKGEKKGKNDNLIMSILDYCVNNYNSEISLNEISKTIKLSKQTISKIFNLQMGMTIPNFVNYLRITQACELLKSTELSITQISVNSGFSTIRSFNRAFKSIHGQTPKEYRNNFNLLQKENK